MFRISKEASYIQLLVSHVFIGILMYALPIARKPFFLAVIVYFLFRIVTAVPAKKTYEVLLACCYVVGAEVLFRMTNATFFYEATKYLVILFVLVGMFYNGVKGGAYPYFLYLILLVPAVVMAAINLDYEMRFRSSVAFVLSGPVCLGVSALYFYRKRVTAEQLLDALVYLSLPVVALTVYLILYTPSIRDVLSGTESNFELSGGFGPNQTSTILGLGIFAFTVRLFLRSPSLQLKLINGLFLGAIGFRAIVTFSRGGVFGAILMILAFLFVLYLTANYKQRQQVISTMVLMGFLGLFTWFSSSNQTEGLIDKRYSGQNAKGEEKEDISTGRVDLFVEEFEGFLQNP